MKDPLWGSLRHSGNGCLTPGNSFWFKAVQMAALILHLVSKWCERGQVEIQASFILCSPGPTPAIPACFHAPAPHSRASQITSQFNPVPDLPLSLGFLQRELAKVSWTRASTLGGEKGDRVQGGRERRGPEGKGRVFGRGSMKIPRGSDVMQNLWL